VTALAALLASVAFAVPHAAPPKSPWPSLRRPLHVPHLAPGAPCPVSARTRAELGAEGSQMLPGRGPVYPNLGGSSSTLEFVWPILPTQVDFYGTGWSGNKVLWWVVGAYHGPVLIRGRQLDGAEVVRFDRGRPVPPAELRIPASRGYAPWKGARDRPSYTRLRAPGCYAYQVDGTSFSRTIVFRARIAALPGP
jgi:hypothetical protein